MSETEANATEEVAPTEDNAQGVSDTNPATSNTTDYNEDAEVEEEEDLEAKEISDNIALSNAGLVKAMDTYRKVIESKELSEKEKEELEKKIKLIEERDVIKANTQHTITEIPVEKGHITIGPPGLTRFEKARIMGARALQLSQGAPPFIEIPATARISLDIAMEELDQKIIPIVIKRVLPNGDYQNIPIDFFN